MLEVSTFVIFEAFDISNLDPLYIREVFKIKRVKSMGGIKKIKRIKSME